MKKYLFCVGLVLMFSIQGRASAATQEIEIFFNELTSSLNSGKAALVADSFREQAELISLAGGIFKGQREIAAFFDEGFQGPYKTGQFENYIQYIRFPGVDSAVVDGIWKIKGAQLTKSPSCGIFLVHLSKRNAQWKIDLFYSSVPREGHTSEHGRTLSWTKICKE